MASKKPKELPNTFTVVEARVHLAEILQRAAKGETTTITRHGFAIARVVPVTEPVK